MNINICKDSKELGVKCAGAVAEYLNDCIEKNGYARIVLSTGASQFDMFEALIKSDVDWSRVEMFHLDEYVGLPETHIASFRKYLKERFISKVNLLAYNLVDGKPESIPELTEKLREKPVDLGIVGIGENGHVAFNDPPADFDTQEAYIVVDLNETCKKQQVGEGWFDTLDDVPKQAISMTVYQILKCKKIISCVPHKVKAEAVRATLHDEISNMVPATKLRTHPDWTLFIDENSASLLDAPKANAPVRCGIIGLGNMGTGYTKFLTQGEVKNVVLTAVADINPERLKLAKEGLPNVKTFATATELMESGEVDAVMIATPHYDHPPLVIEALKNGLHVVSEKPAGVYTKQVREEIEAAGKSDKVFAMMFNVRTYDIYRKVKEIVSSGKYGEIRRTNWLITDWYRTQAYYNSGGWRATWAGEGGGVLLNQCPHNLDLWQWICGMPVKVRAFCKEGKWHDIEVEDDVTIYAEYENGATGTFITSTGDFPGTNRFEILLDKAKIVCENNSTVKIYELEQPISEHCKNAEEGFSSPKIYEFVPETDGIRDGHVGVLNAFVNNILYGTPLLAKGEEGIRGLMISNAAHLSSWLDKEVTLPIDEDLFYEELKKKIANSKEKKVVTNTVAQDMNKSFR